MLRAYLIVVGTVALGLGAGSARADHDEELRYVVGGALIGAALGELAYVETVAHRHYGYHPRPRGWYRHHRYPGRFDPFRRHGGHRYLFRHRHGGYWGHPRRYCPY